MGMVNTMQINNKVLSIIVLVVFLSVSLFSYNYIVENIDHNCTMEECSICVQLEVIIKSILNLKFTIIIPFIVIIICLFLHFSIIERTSFSVKKTLISLKVELLN